MSYTIVYERRFLRTSGGKIIPLALYGSNNCYESCFNGRERRERSWNSIFTGRNHNIALTPDELRAIAKSWIGGEYQQHFVYHGKWVDDAGLLRFAENGIKTAKTVEELNQASLYKIYLSGSLSIWYRDGSYADGTLREGRRSELSCTIQNSSDLDAFLARVQERLDKRTPDEEIYVLLRFPGDKAVEYPRESRKKSAPTRLDQFYAIMVKRLSGNGYIRKLTASKIHMTFRIEDCKQFRNESDARKWMVKHRIEDRFHIEYELAYFDKSQKEAV